MLSAAIVAFFLPTLRIPLYKSFVSRLSHKTVPYLQSSRNSLSLSPFRASFRGFNPTDESCERIRYFDIDTHTTTPTTSKIRTMDEWTDKKGEVNLKGPVMFNYLNKTMNTSMNKPSKLQSFTLQAFKAHPLFIISFLPPPSGMV